MSLESGPSFLKNKYNLHASEEVASAAKRTNKQTGEKVLNKPSELIDNYLNRFKEILDRPDPLDRQQGIDALKRLLLTKFVTKFEDIPDSYWQSQENIIRDRGQQGDYNNYSAEQKTTWKKEISQGLLEDQTASLEQWIDYLSSQDSSYMPDYLKYWTFRSVTNLAEYDKDKQEFPDRSKGTVKMFPDINHEALAYVIDATFKKHQGESLSWENFNYDLTEEQKKQFTTSLNNQNFAKLYAWANEQIHPIAKHLLPVTEGKWIKYERDNEDSQNFKLLNQSIRGKGTGWCTAGEKTAKTQLQVGDFYCFYSNDDDGQPTIPRIAIRMEAGNIAEVRGIATKQNLDPYMGEVLNKKLQEFPDKDQYLKKEHDMSRLTQIYNKCFKEDKQTKEKIYLNPTLNKDELSFIYEIDTKIEGFGYETDPRIEEIKQLRDVNSDIETMYGHNLSVAGLDKSALNFMYEIDQDLPYPLREYVVGLRETRNKQEDMLAALDCTKDQITNVPSQITKDTKAYLGKLEPGIFDLIQKYNIKHVYTKFPEGKIRKEDIEFGGKTAEQLIDEMKKANINISDDAIFILNNTKEFVRTKNTETNTIICLTLADLGLNYLATKVQIYKRAEELGLELCPPDLGLNFRLKYRNQPTYERLVICMKQITNYHGDLDVFELDRRADGLWLNSDGTESSHMGYSDSKFVFRLRSDKMEDKESGVKGS